MHDIVLISFGTFLTANHAIFNPITKHPENAHDGTLLEGFDKTIDHRFFVEESDHRRIWNDNLTEQNSKMYIPARPKQMDENGELVVADDLLSGSGHVRTSVDVVADASKVQNDEEVTSHRSKHDADLITFD